jgi:hypothetical protein
VKDEPRKLIALTDFDAAFVVVDSALEGPGFYISLDFQFTV